MGGKELGVLVRKVEDGSTNNGIQGGREIGGFHAAGAAEDASCVIDHDEASFVEAVAPQGTGGHDDVRVDAFGVAAVGSALDVRGDQ